MVSEFEVGGVYVTPLGQELALDYPRQANGSPHIIHKLFCNARQVSDVGADPLAELFPASVTIARYDNTTWVTESGERPADCYGNFKLNIQEH